MQEKKWDQEIQELLAQLNIDLEGLYAFIQGLRCLHSRRTRKKKLVLFLIIIEKRFKKSTIDATESSETALNKTNKLVSPN